MESDKNLLLCKDVYPIDKKFIFVYKSEYDIHDIDETLAYYSGKVCKIVGYTYEDINKQTLDSDGQMEIQFDEDGSFAQCYCNELKEIQ